MSNQTSGSNPLVLTLLFILIVGIASIFGVKWYKKNRLMLLSRKRYVTAGSQHNALVSKVRLLQKKVPSDICNFREEISRLEQAEGRNPILQYCTHRMTNELTRLEETLGLNPAHRTFKKVDTLGLQFLGGWDLSKYQAVTLRRETASVPVQQELATFQNYIDILGEVEVLHSRAKSSMTVGFTGPRELPWSEYPFNALITGEDDKSRRLVMMRDLKPKVSAVVDACERKSSWPLRIAIVDRYGYFSTFLRGLGLTEAQLFNVNACDKRCRGWKTGYDISTRDEASVLAKLLIESTTTEKRSQAVADLYQKVSGILESYILYLVDQKGKNWDLYDVVSPFILKPREILRLMSEEIIPTGEGLWDGNRNEQDIINLLSMRLQPLYLTALVWREQLSKGRAFSLKSWAQGSGILLISSFGRILEENSRRACQLLFAMTISLLERSAIPQLSGAQNTWIFSEDIDWLGPVPSLNHLLANGTHAGISMTLSFKSILNLKRALGNFTADQLLSEITRSTILKSRKVTAEWAATQCQVIFAERQAENVFSDNAYNQAHSLIQRVDTLSDSVPHGKQEKTTSTTSKIKMLLGAQPQGSVEEENIESYPQVVERYLASLCDSNAFVGIRPLSPNGQLQAIFIDNPGDTDCEFFYRGTIDVSEVETLCNDAYFSLSSFSDNELEMLFVKWEKYIRGIK